MNLLEQVKTALEFEDVSVAHNTTSTPAGLEMDNYVVNKHGVVLQFAIASTEEDEGVIEDFLEYIEASVADID